MGFVSSRFEAVTHVDTGYSLEVKSPFLKGWFANHPYFSRDLSSSKRFPTISLKWWQRLDFQGILLIDEIGCKRVICIDFAVSLLDFRGV